MSLKRNILILSIITIILSLNLNSNRIEEKVINNYIESSSTKTSYNKDVLGILEIPSIKFKKIIYNKDSLNNNVNKNIEILPSSDLPDKDKGNVIIAGHSGIGDKAYFNNLINLNINDIANIYYNNTKYTYKLDNIYEIEKTGMASIIKNKNLSTLTLITCKINTNKQIIFIFNLINQASIN